MDKPGTFIKLALIAIVVVAIGVTAFRTPRSQWQDLVEEIPMSDAPFKDTETTPTSPTKATPSRQAPTVQQQYVPQRPSATTPVRYDVVVRYTKTGFSPAIVTVNRGQTIRFINNSSYGMRITSASSRNGAVAEINSSLSTLAGESFYFTANTPGSYNYYNLNHSQDAGVLIVK